MAVTFYSGVDGYLWASALLLNVRSWSISMSAGVQTGAHSSSLGWTEAVAGVKNWTASVEVYDDTSLAAAPQLEIGDVVTCQFWDGHRAFDGGAIVTDVTFSCDIEGGGLVSASASIQGTAELAIGITPPA